MGVLQKFGIAFLTFFGMFLLYFNLCLVWNIQPFPNFFNGSRTMWSSDYYFGFESIMEMIHQFPTDLYISEFNENLGDFADSLGTLRDTLRNFSTFIEDGDFFALLKVLVNLFTAPIQAIYYFLVTTINITITIIELIVYVVRLFRGDFNIPMSVWSNTLDSADGLLGLTTDSSGGVVITSLTSVA